MKKLVFLFGLLVSLNQCAFGAAAADPVDAARLSPAIKQVQDGLYTAAIEPGLWFVLEAQNADSIKGWQQYCKDQRDSQSRLMHVIGYACRPKEFDKRTIMIEGVEWDFYEPKPKPELKGTLSAWEDVIHNGLQGLAAFEKQLEYFEKRVLRQLWVAYAIHAEKAPMAPCAGDNFQKVELTFAVATDPDIPFTNHMGISRSLTYIESHFGSSAVEGKPSAFPLHNRMSGLLHAFAGNVMHALFPEKYYMITSPILTQKIMLVDELSKAGLPLTAVWLGDSATYEALAAQTDPRERADDFVTFMQWVLPEGPIKGKYNEKPETVLGRYSEVMKLVIEKKCSPITFGKMSYSHYRGTPTFDDMYFRGHEKYRPEDFCWQLRHEGKLIFDARVLAESSLATGTEAPVLEWYFRGVYHDWSTGNGNYKAFTVLLSALADTFNIGLVARAAKKVVDAPSPAAAGAGAGGSGAAVISAAV